MKNKNLLINIIKNIFVWLMSISMLIPISLILVNSFKSKGEALGMSFKMPSKVLFENYLTVIEKGDMGTAFINSMIYTVVSVGLIILFSSMAAYVLSRNKTKRNSAIYIFLVLGMTLNLNHVALMKIMEVLKLLNTRIGLILIYTAIQIPFAVFLIYNFIATVPCEIDEAAVIDGCTPLKMFFRIVLPLLKPAVVSVAILNFLNSWNEFILPLYYLNDSNLWPMTNSIYAFFGKFSASWNLVSANMVLTSLPVIMIYLLGQKYLVSGITSGSVKG